MANIFEFLSKDGNITPEKARKSRQMPFHDKTAYVWMGMLPLKKRVNRDKCSFATKQRMFGVFAIDEILRYRGSRIPGSPTLCHPGARQTKNAHLMISESSGNKQSMNIFFLKIWHCLFSGIRDIYFAKPERPFLFRNCSFINAAVKYYCRCIPPLLGEFAQS